MKILSIETSCDDTCITIFEAKGGIKNASFKILANSSNSQINTHIPYGGVYPVMAKREHIKNLPIVFEKSWKEAKIKKIDLIAVTYGPRLEMCLWEGITFAQKLAKKWKVPIVPVNHMEGHIWSVLLQEPTISKSEFLISKKIQMPAIALLVSGGHTQLVLVKGFGKYEIIGETLDDAVGEAFDKVARMLDLPYPGGPHISALAEKLRNIPLLRGGSLARRGGKIHPPPPSGTPQEENFKLPRPMLYSKNFNFSFAGLKTAVLYLIRDLKKQHSNILQNDKIKQAIALEFENAAIECLVYKTAKAIEKYKVKTLIVGGGVAANKYLRNEIKKIKKIKIYFPTPLLSGDNSIMIGVAGYLNYVKNKSRPQASGKNEPQNIK